MLHMLVQIERNYTYENGRQTVFAIEVVIEVLYKSVLLNNLINL